MTGEPIDKEWGQKCLTGPGNRLLFRHKIDGLEMKAVTNQQ